MAVLFLKDGKNVEIPWKMVPIERVNWFSNLQVAKDADKAERDLIIMKKLHELADKDK